VLTPFLQESGNRIVHVGCYLHDPRRKPRRLLPRTRPTYAVVRHPRGADTCQEAPCHIDGWHAYYEVAYGMWQWWRKEYPDQEVHLVIRYQ
jgi:hypothetical protein